MKMDFERFRVGHDIVAGQPRHSRKPFLKGPISLDWLSAAAHLSGRTLHVALALQHSAALQKSMTVKVPRKIREAFGISDGLYGHALKRLENAKLVTVERENGKAPQVTITLLPDPPEGGE
jgi:hypothetical protein